MARREAMMTVMAEELTPGGESAFYAGLPIVDGFARVLDPEVYRSLPDGWQLGVADVVRSTEAIRRGRYKAVNMAGAAVIAAVRNALAGRATPFVFSGDGAGFAVPAEDSDTAGRALAATVGWVRDELGLELRAAMIPVAAARVAGFDVRVARFAASPLVSYAMFAGGGLAWAEEQLKKGCSALPPAPSGERPDLTGLSCRWEPIPTAQGVTLSIILVAAEDPSRFRALVGELLRLVEEGAGGPPLADGRLRVRWPPTGLDLEVRASRRGGEGLARRRLAIGLHTLLSWVVLRAGIPVGRFDPASYRRDLVANADFRKYDDGLRMTLDCSPALADRIEGLLCAAREQGLLRFGLHRQAAALMTCFVPSIYERDHLHFIDGADGGYAAAAAMLKRS